MNYYSWMESTACLCSQALIVDLQEAAATALQAVLWTMGGVACLWFGALLASVQSAADFVLLTADYQYMRATRKRSSSGSPRRTYTDYLQSPPSMVKQQSSAYQVYARSGGAATMYNRSPSGFLEK